MRLIIYYYSFEEGKKVKQTLNNSKHKRQQQQQKKNVNTINRIAAIIGTEMSRPFDFENFQMIYLLLCVLCYIRWQTKNW